jgi:hypothetical protein
LSRSTPKRVVNRGDRASNPEDVLMNFPSV